MNVGDKAVRIIELIRNVVSHKDETATARKAVLDVVQNYIDEQRGLLDVEDNQRVAEMVKVATAATVDASLPVISAELNTSAGDAQ